MPSTNYDRMLKEVVQEAKDQARYFLVEVGGGRMHNALNTAIL